MLLTEIEARVLGSLMEKEVTTPEVYPLSLNALLAAANQKSSREPVMHLTEPEVRRAVRSLEDQELVAVDHGSRVERFENQARTVFQLRRDETALLCLLLLRGPQTPGELRGRAERLFAFDDVPSVLAALGRMREGGAGAEGGTAAATGMGSEKRAALVVSLERQPGSREQRYAHLLCGAPAEATRSESHAADSLHAEKDNSGPETTERLAALESAVAALAERVAQLERAGEAVAPAGESGL